MRYSGMLYPAEFINRAADQRVAWWAKRQLGVVDYPRNPPFESYYFARHAGPCALQHNSGLWIKPLTFSTYFQLI